MVALLSSVLYVWDLGWEKNTFEKKWKLQA